MPAALSYPGVYIEEIPSGVRTIVGVATSIAAFVGRTLRGPVDEPIVINSFGDFERQFGGIWGESMLGYAVRDFYLNGGSQAVIVRLFHPGADLAAHQAEEAKAAAAASEITKAARDAAAIAGATKEQIIGAIAATAVLVSERGRAEAVAARTVKGGAEDVAAKDKIGGKDGVVAAVRAAVAAAVAAQGQRPEPAEAAAAVGKEAEDEGSVLGATALSVVAAAQRKAVAIAVDAASTKAESAAAAAVAKAALDGIAGKDVTAQEVVDAAVAAEGRAAQAGADRGRSGQWDRGRAPHDRGPRSVPCARGRQSGPMGQRSACTG